MDIEEVLQTYIDRASEYPLLTAEEEVKLHNLVKYSRKPERVQMAREKMMNSNVRLVINLARRYYHPTVGVTIIDIINSGHIGLAKAVDKYNYRKFKTRFTTYATSWIKQSILQALYAAKRRVYVPPHIVESSRQMHKIKQGKAKTDSDLMKEMDLTKSNLLRVKGARVSVVPLVMDHFGKDGEVSREEIILPDEKAIMPSRLAELGNDGEVIMKAIKILTPEEQDIINARFFSSPPRKLRDLGKKYRVTGETIRLREAAALRKLKWSLKSQGVSL